MTDYELNHAPTDETVLQQTPDVAPVVEAPTDDGRDSPVPETVAVPMMNDEPVEGTNGVGAPHWRAEAGRKGARRVHQLIEEGKLYEREHGLKSGRQRLRQLIELGKVYEREHGVQSEPVKRRGERLDRMERADLLGTLLQCLLRIAKPSFRAELEQLVEALRAGENGTRRNEQRPSESAYGPQPLPDGRCS